MQQPVPQPPARDTVEPGSSGALRWKTRRGTRELDLILQRHLEHRYPAAGPAERHAFERLLEESDADLLGWIFAARPWPPEYADVLGALTARR